MLTPAEVSAVVARVRALLRRDGTPEGRAAAAAFEALAAAWEATMRPAFADALRAAASLPPGATEAQVRAALSPILAAGDGAFLADALPPYLSAVADAASGAARTLSASVGVTFGGPDRRTQAWAQRHGSYWVTRAGERRLEPRIAEIVSRTAGEGLGERAAADALQEALGEEYGKGLKYWRLVATAVTARSGTLGRIDALVATNRDGKLDGTGDDRQSAVCDYLDGRRVPLAELVRWREAVLGAPTPDAVNEADPWWNDRDVGEGGKLRRLVEGAGGAVPAEGGLPGYHPHCRTILVAGPRAETPRADV